MKATSNLEKQLVSEVCEDQECYSKQRIDRNFLLSVLYLILSYFLH